MKKVLGVYSAPRLHWVGDGFPVRSVFSYNTHGTQLSPFLLMDHAGPHNFPPSDKPRGVGQHPHRGFETVTIVYEGEVEHRDSTGAGGVIGPGDVQWMTAASGILHEEFHSPAFSRRGGTLDMVQLWVNLPAKDKADPAEYQTLLDSEISRIALEGDAGELRMIAGEYAGVQGPARTRSPMNIFDVHLRHGKQMQLKATDGWILAIAVLKGAIRANRSQSIRNDQFVVFDAGGSGVFIEADDDSTFLVLSGEPIDEPVVGFGPFVMNTQAEINQAFEDFNSGRFGQIHHA